MRSMTAKVFGGFVDDFHFGLLGFGALGAKRESASTHRWCY